MIYIDLYHGRVTPDETLMDWGRPGPLLGPFSSIHVTYATLRCFTNHHDEVELEYVQDLLYYDGIFYGDFAITTDPLLRGEKQVEQIEENKAKLPFNWRVYAKENNL